MEAAADKTRKNHHKFIDDWQAQRAENQLQERTYLANLTQKYLTYVAGPENFAHILDARLSDEYGGPIKPQNHSTGYLNQEHRYATHIWVYAAVNVIAEKSAVPVLEVQDADGEAYESSMPKMPNPNYTWDECEQLISIFLELTGNAYLYHDKEEDTFWPMRPSRMKIVVDDKNREVVGYAYNNSDKGPSGQRQPTFTKSWMYDNPELIYTTKSEFRQKFAEYHGWITKGQMGIQRLQKDDDWIPFEADEILHFRYVSPTHDLYGMAPICTLMTNLQTDLFAREWNLNFFENGAIPPGVLVIPKVFPDKEFDKIKRQFNKEFLGTKNRGKPLVVQGGAEGATYTPFPGQHRDLEFLEGLNRNRDETLAVFGVPHVMVQAQMTGSHSSALSPGIREMRKIFWQDTIMPKQKMKAAVWTKHYQKDLPEGFMFAYNYSEIEDLKPDYAERGKAAINAIRGGMTIEEVRENIWGVSPEWEGTILVPANMRPMRHGEVMPAPAPALPAPEGEESMEDEDIMTEPAAAADDD